MKYNQSFESVRSMIVLVTAFTLEKALEKLESNQGLKILVEGNIVLYNRVYHHSCIHCTIKGLPSCHSNDNIKGIHRFTIILHVHPVFSNRNDKNFSPEAGCHYYEIYVIKHDTEVRW